MMNGGCVLKGAYVGERVGLGSVYGSGWSSFMAVRCEWRWEGHGKKGGGRRKAFGRNVRGAEKGRTGWAWKRRKRAAFCLFAWVRWRE